jgi:hypothetical protein
MLLLLSFESKNQINSGSIINVGVTNRYSEKNNKKRAYLKKI